MNAAALPRVGVAALVLHEGRLLLGQRRKSPGVNTWQCPGGLLEQGESVFECARRETLEETGIQIHNLRYGPYTNNRFANPGDHSVTLYVLADYMGGDIVRREPERADHWQWVDVASLPQPLFLPLALLLEKQADWWRSVIATAD